MAETITADTDSSDAVGRSTKGMSAPRVVRARSGNRKLTREEINDRSQRTRNITFNAHGMDIDVARRRASERATTLNEEFRQWLAAYAREQRADEAMAFLEEELRTRVKTGGRKFTRDEMNER